MFFNGLLELPMAGLKFKLVFREILREPHSFLKFFSTKLYSILNNRLISFAIDLFASLLHCY